MWNIFAVLVQLQTKNDRPCKSHCHKRHRFQSQQKDQRHHKDVIMHLSSLQWVTAWKASWCHGSGGGNSQPSLSVLSCLFVSTGQHHWLSNSHHPSTSRCGVTKKDDFSNFDYNEHTQPHTALTANQRIFKGHQLTPWELPQICLAIVVVTTGCTGCCWSLGWEDNFWPVFKIRSRKGVYRKVTPSTTVSSTLQHVDFIIFNIRSQTKSPKWTVTYRYYPAGCSVRGNSRKHWIPWKTRVAYSIVDSVSTLQEHLPCLHTCDARRCSRSAHGRVAQKRSNP